jgi:predicted RNA binding protein YcfA (HicA-like mRNA interferase family)
MGKRKYPPLTPGEIRAILQRLGFSKKNQEGSHEHYERPADARRLRSVVTVDSSISEFGEHLLRSMIRQSGFSREEFYGATKGTAKKAAVCFLKQRDAQ